MSVYEITMTQLYGVSIDTYQCFTGDMYLENESQWLEEEASVHGWSDDELMRISEMFMDSVSFDHERVRNGLAELALDFVVDHLNEQSDEPVILSAELNSSWSPRYYNFATDGFSAMLDVDEEVLAQLTPEFDLHKYVHEYWDHAPGFISFIPSRIDREGDDGETAMQMRLDYLCRLSGGYLDDELFMHLAEHENELYAEAATLTPEFTKAFEALPH